MEHLLRAWRGDPGGTYRSWFLWNDRIKNFRSIRGFIKIVIAEIEAGTFGTLYKGSSIATVVGTIAEQRQIFRGADHAFIWKPKLRIPDIYENADHQRSFGKFLDTCCGCDCAEDIVSAIHALDRKAIKGLGPAVANMLYFLHPTLAPPFNTAMVAGYNALTGSRVKLGKWTDYLAMRDGILRLNAQHQGLLSNDLGAIAGLLFDLGKQRYPVPPTNDDVEARRIWERDVATARASSVAAAEHSDDVTHTIIQGWLRDLGLALGFAVWIASNDQGRDYGDGTLGDGCLETLPPWLVDNAGADAVGLIDVLWIDPKTHDVAAGFEVEHSTSIYSGILRLLDLALCAPERAVHGLFLVAPDVRERDVRAQIARPAFQRVADLAMRFLPYSELESHRDAMARFGEGLGPVLRVSRPLS